MIFRWLRNQRRRRWWKQELPLGWEDILSQNAQFLSEVDEESEQQVIRSVQIFVKEKNWEGCGGLKLTDEHRVTIAAQVAKMTLGLGAGDIRGEYFEEVKSVLVYPDAYLAKTQESVGSGVVLESQSGRLGEAWHRGPVILSWADVLATGRRENFARNVVIHEFAHHLDMRNGPMADGFPVIESREFARQWERVVKQGFDRLQQQCNSGYAQVLDCYGATNMAEFFAVASEAFFEEPYALDHHWPELFQVLNRFHFPEETD
ncbi:MAG: M90 family metallopeptidase [Planctomycetota bacterium]